MGGRSNSPRLPCFEFVQSVAPLSGARALSEVALKTMRDTTPSLFPVFAAAALGFAALAAIFLWSDPVQADAPALRPTMTAPDEQAAAKPPSTRVPEPRADSDRPARTALRPSFIPAFSRMDRTAALESVQLALSRVADGSTYVWHRGHGRLSGVVRPTRSYRDANGRVCREFLVMYASGNHSAKTKTHACRLESGIWSIEG